MWIAQTRSQHNRDDLRYTSDLTDAGWQSQPFRRYHYTYPLAFSRMTDGNHSLRV